MLFKVAILSVLVVYAKANWPCPDAAAIAPCVCSQDTNLALNMDCSQVKSDAELKTAFSADFPFTNFYSLIINGTECTNCSLKVLGLDTFGTANFERVTIIETTVHNVEEGAFANSHQTLKYWNLNHNAIDSFPFEAVGVYSELQTLYLADNKFANNDPIEAIVSDSLLTLSLAYNPKLNFDANLVKGCPKLKTFVVKSGELAAVPVFNTSPYGMFSGLQNIHNIDFSHNEIRLVTTATILGEANTLGRINFANNQIDTLYSNFVSGFGSNGYLDLSNNLIKYLDEIVWHPILEQLGNPKTCQLQGNPLQCGCEIAWLVRNQTLHRIITSETTCEDGTTHVSDLNPAWYDANCP